MAILLSVAWVLAIVVAVNDWRILRSGRIDEETNMTGLTTAELNRIPERPGFIRLVASLRLVVASAWIIGLAVRAIRGWLT